MNGLFSWLGGKDVPRMRGAVHALMLRTARNVFTNTRVSGMREVRTHQKCAAVLLRPGMIHDCGREGCGMFAISTHQSMRALVIIKKP